jgi:hypothetical protein
MVTNTTQLSLTRPEWFQPVPAGAGHYVVALQSLTGERDALANASAETWAHLTPLIQIVGPKKQEKEPFRRTRVAAWVKKVSDAVDGHSCFLDILRLKPGDRTETKQGERPVLSVIYEEARKQSMAFVPVLRLRDTRATVGLIQDAVQCDGRGVAVRYPMLGSASADGRSPQTLLKESLDAIGVECNGADLILDLGFLSDDVEIHAEDVLPAVDDLIAVGEWRSVVLLATAMHRSLGGGVVREGTVGRLPRREWQLWSALRASGATRLPTYGDYAVQHPEPPLDGESSGPGMRANVRYTLDDETVVPRGRGPLQQEGAEQYRGLCRQITAEPQFAGPQFTWGDALIDECANGIGDPGSQSRWRGAGTSHHLRHVVEQLAREVR